MSPSEPLVLSAIENLPEIEQAEAITDRVFFLSKTIKESYIEQGMLCSYVRIRTLWVHVGCTSFEQWIKDYCPWGRTKVFEAARTYEELSKDIPSEKLTGIDRDNALELIRVSSDYRDKDDILEAARNQDNNGFLAHLANNYPELHLEPRKPLQIKCNPETSAHEVIDRSIKLAMELENLSSRSAVIEMWAEDYWEKNGDKAEYADIA